MPKPEETRPPLDRISAALIAAVAERGLEATTVEEILVAAAVSEAEFEALFSGKQDCFDQVWEKMIGDFTRDLQVAYGGDGPWRERLREAARHVLDYFQADVPRATFFMIGSLSGGDIAQARRDRLIELGIDLIDGGREELDDPGSMSRSTAEGVGGAIYRAIVVAVGNGDPDVGEELLPELMYLAVLPYLGREAALQELHRG